MVTNPEAARVGRYDCPLCFLYNWGEDDFCQECPVFLKTGQRYCDGSPFIPALKALQEWKSVYTLEQTAEAYAAQQVFRKAALDEVAFLSEIRQDLVNGKLPVPVQPKRARYHSSKLSNYYGTVILELAPGQPPKLSLEDWNGVHGVEVTPEFVEAWIKQFPKYEEGEEGGEA